MKIQIHTQKILSFTIAYMVSFLGLLNGINALTNAVGYNTSLDTMVMYGLLWGLAAFSWLCMLRKMKIDGFFIIMILAFFFTVTLLFFPDNAQYIHAAIYTFSNHPVLILFVYSFSGYIAIRCLTDYQDLLKYLKFFSYLIILLSAIIYFWIKDGFANQYMTLSYNMLLQVSFLLFFPPEKRKLLNRIFVGLGIFIIVFGGARGAMVALITAIIAKILGFESNIQTNRKKIATIFLFLLGGIAYLFYEELLIMMNAFIESLGFASRNLAMLMATSGDVSTGRFEIYERLLGNTTLFGHGLYGDRVILDGIYAHNLFVEWITEFGILGGGCLSVIYVLLLVRGYRRSDELSRKLMLVLIPNGLVGLMFSSSYLAQQPVFYVLLGLCVNVILRYDGNRMRDNEET